MNTSSSLTRDAEFVDVSDIQGVRRLLGELLVDAGTLTAAEVQRIIEEQAHTGQRFGEAARTLGLASSQEIEQALSRQFTCPRLAIGDRSLSPKIATAFRPFGPIGESMRSLRARLMMRWFDGSRRQKALAIVGVERGAGRSFFAANLAVMFAQSGERTLLIDANLKRPTQHLLFKLSNPRRRSGSPSHSDVVKHLAHFDAFPELSVLPAGALPQAAPGRIAADRFTGLLDHLAADFDAILVDTPAAAESGDAQLIAERTHGALLIARRDRTPPGQLAELDTSLQHAEVSLMGLVFNNR